MGSGPRDGAPPKSRRKILISFSGPLGGGTPHGNWFTRSAMRVIIAMVFVEPMEVYATRSSRPSTIGRSTSVAPSAQKQVCSSSDLYAPLSVEDGWDETIVAYLSSRPGTPVMIMAIVSQLRKCVRHRDRRHREKLKHDILMRVGALIRAGVIVRFKRKYVVARPACA